MMSGKIVGVSLGPGDPELVTLKALKSLNEVDVIYCPDVQDCGGHTRSRALDVLRQLPVDQVKIQLFHVPVSRSKEEILKAYDCACDSILALAESGRSVAIITEGDACFYSSANYIYKKLQQAGYPSEMIAGVPDFIAAGASMGIQLVEQQERLLVVPGNVLVEELLEPVVARRVLVILKVPLGEAVIRPFMIRHPELQYHYFEQPGTSGEYYTSVPEEILSRSFTYYSILVIRYKE